MLSRFILFAGLVAVAGFSAKSQSARSYYELRVVHYHTPEQGERLDAYLKNAWVPALHRAGVASVGVWTAVGNDTAADKKMVLLIPVRTLQQIMDIRQKLDKDKIYWEAGKDVKQAAYDNPAYDRIETIILLAFPLAPQPQKPQLSGPVTDRIYELRSYESPSLALHQNKVKMFNDGGEIALFKRLGFNAVFYSSVVSGAHMPNLMYMTSFDNMAEREAHWKAFGSDPAWKELSARPEYQHNVSHIDITFLHPASYSDY